MFSVKKLLILLGTLIFIVVSVPYINAEESSPHMGISSTIYEQYNIDENTIIKKATPEIFGINYEWGSQSAGIYDGWPVNRVPTEEDTRNFRETLRDFGLKMPLNRMAGSSSQAVKWKNSIGPWDGRKPAAGTAGNGPVDWVKAVLGADPDAQFVLTLNCMLDTPQDHADYVEFLTGDPGNDRNGGTNWAAKRVEYGLADPVKVIIWEFGNELDLPVERRERFSSVEIYKEYVKESIQLMREVDPNVPLSVMAPTSPWTAKNLMDGTVFMTPETWRDWHTELFKDDYIRETVDNIAFHSYYIPYRRNHEIGNPYGYEAIINTIADDIKRLGKEVNVYISEHAVWARDITLPNGGRGRNPDEAHSLLGGLYLGEYFTRLLGIPSVSMATVHLLYGDGWGVIDLDTYGKRYVTVIGEIINLFLDNLGEGIYKQTQFVDNTLRMTEFPDVSMSVAMSTEDGMNIFLVNRSDRYNKDIQFTFSNNDYILTGQSILTGDSLLSTIKGSDTKGITVTHEELSTNNIFKQYVLPKQSIVVLRLKNVTGSSSAVNKEETDKLVTIVYLASDASAYLTGATIALDGGYSAK